MSNQQKHHYYDESFTEVFSNRTIIEPLLRSFVGEPWVELLDFGSMTVEPSVFKEIENRRREGDLLIHFTLKTGEKFSVFILLEFQSTPESMALRLLEYVTRIYNRQLGSFGHLAPVVPIVIYNGNRKWQESPQLSSQFQFLPEELLKYVPDFEYLLIDENLLDDAVLLELENAAAYFFYLDKTNVKQRETAAERIIDVLKKVEEKIPDTYDLLRRYIIGLLAHRGVEIQMVKKYTNERSKPMLAQSMDELKEEGREEGRVEGELQEKRKVLVRLINKKFVLADEEAAMIRNCTSPEQLDKALDEVLFAESKMQVLEMLRE